MNTKNYHQTSTQENDLIISRPRRTGNQGTIMPRSYNGQTGKSHLTSNGGVPVVFWKLGLLGYDGRLPSFRSVPSSAGEVVGIARSVRVKVAGWVGFAGQTGSITLSPSLSRALLSFLFWKPASHFPFIETNFFFFNLHLSLIQIKLITEPVTKIKSDYPSF